MTLLMLALNIIESKYPGTAIKTITHKYKSIYVFQTETKAGRVNVDKCTCTLSDIHHLENIN